MSDLDKPAVLTTIAAAEAANGHAWASLHIQMVADVLTLAALLAENKDAIVDIAPLRALPVPSVLSSAVDAHRKSLLGSVKRWELADTLQRKFIPHQLPAIGLDEDPDTYARFLVQGRTAAESAERLSVRAQRLAAMAESLEVTDMAAAARTRVSSAVDAFTGHHVAEAVRGGDDRLALVETAVHAVLIGVKGLRASAVGLHQELLPVTASAGCGSIRVADR